MIYIIDDDVNVLRGFQILLKSAGLVSTAFDNVEEFLCRWRKREEDMLLLDIQMPGIDGCDLLDYLEMRNLKIPVILITAYDKPENRIKAERYGVLAYLTKPVDSEILIDLIKTRTRNSTNYPFNNN
jgi:FixJ family two-component response regulator